MTKFKETHPDVPQGRIPDYAREYARKHPLRRSHVKQLDEFRRLCTNYELVSELQKTYLVIAAILQ